MTSILHRAALNQQAWDDLLDFLDPGRREKSGSNRDVDAERQYLEIKRRLESFFAGRGCPDADDLADETTLRVAANAHDLVDTEANQLAYFYGVARNVLHEWQRDSQRELRKLEAASRDPALRPCESADDSQDRTHLCLERCMTTLTQRARRLILSYYGTQTVSRTECHRRLSEEFGKSANALRIEVHRIRKTLRWCVSGCMHMGSAR
jgi:RNA polymerase sigma factor (sigma-70 family)